MAIFHHAKVRQLFLFFSKYKLIFKKRGVHFLASVAKQMCYFSIQSGERWHRNELSESTSNSARYKKA
jgi:hypothetical protein